jgi:hypothetical protein
MPEDAAQALVAAPGTGPEWAMVRALAASACEQAARGGCVQEHFGPWSVCAQPCACDTGNDNCATVLVTILHGQWQQARWRVAIPSSMGVARGC